MKRHADRFVVLWRHAGSLSKRTDSISEARRCRSWLQRLSHQKYRLFFHFDYATVRREVGFVVRIHAAVFVRLLHWVRVFVRHIDPTSTDHRGSDVRDIS
ncbi:MAG: hypothetical protein OXD42_09100, partial [Rhodospirillaceae bacterium]|nr:hypothetical protein [Rhodospirillaceae bacterium]